MSRHNALGELKRKDLEEGRQVAALTGGYESAALADRSRRQVKECHGFHGRGTLHFSGIIYAVAGKKTI
jgi:hypothetical protein